jgi:ATP-dependent helicase/nuclease subunit A
MSDTRPAGAPTSQLSLFGPEVPAVPEVDAPGPPSEAESGNLEAGSAKREAPIDPDARARDFAIDPRNNVVLEASAGTGKTSVLVWRYVNLLKAGVEPGNILAITFTRKAAAEMRERIIRELKAAASRSEFDKARWTEVRDRLADISISTIDAFCLSLLREFPLEADLDPGFEMADETEVPRLVEASLDRSLRIFAGLAKTEPDVAVVLAQLGISRTREGLAALLERRLVAWDALNRFLARGPSDLTAEVVCRRAATSLQDALRAVPGGLERFLADGPVAHPRYQLLVRDLRRLFGTEQDDAGAGDAQIRALVDRVAAHFLTADGSPRKAGAIHPYNTERDYPSTEASKRHRQAVAQIAPHIENVVFAFSRDLNVVLARGIKRMFAIALTQYRQALEERSVLDFSDVLQRALDLLRQMDEFSQSRFRLESRYHHVLVDEFQDTSRAQWELVSLLIQSWGEGLGLATRPSIFIVGDRKQSIYRFRDADVAVLREAGRYIEALRPAGNPHRSISRSFRALPELLEFINELFSEMSQSGARPDDFTYTGLDRFPASDASAGLQAGQADEAGLKASPTSGDRNRLRGPVLGMAVAEDPVGCAAAVAAEIERILREETVRDRKTGVPRQARPGDVAILFRSRTSHREFEHELEVRGIPTYVYKGLGFFDADEIKDLSALMRYLADPGSNLRAAAFLRSRFIRISDRGLARLGPRLAAAITDPQPPAETMSLDEEDRGVLEYIRARVSDWLDQVDRVPPADLIEQLLPATAYAYELRGPRRQQAWENLKKMRGLVRRIQNRGYATLARIADHIDSLTAGDESNAVIEALDAVNLMTVHASKGLEFPIVFVVNLARGASGPPRPVRVIVDGEGGEPSVSVGPFVSETDDTERDREKQETRRLMYVALTRARDRLYLSSVLKDGVLQPGRGSLAEVLPDSLKQLFGRAATAFDEFAVLGWAGQSGRPFEWRICRVPETIVSAGRPEPQVPEARPGDTFGPVRARRESSTLRQAQGRPEQSRGTSAAPQRVGVEPHEQVIDDADVDAAPMRVSVTEWLTQTPDVELHTPAAKLDGAADIRDITAGTLVHRLFQFGTVPGGRPEDEEAAYALGLLKPEERAALEDVEATVAAAVSAWRAMRTREDVSALLGSGSRFHEVPFSLLVETASAPHGAGNGPMILRGTIDCLIRPGDGSVVVLEFKSGAPRAFHQRQLDLYVEAARALFPGTSVKGRLIYPDYLDNPRPDARLVPQA